MALLMRKSFLVQIAISFCFSIALFANGSIATQTTNGLLLANLCPQLERGSLGVYAITTSSPSPIGGDLDLEISKDTGLPTSATQFSLINIDSFFWGCSLCVHPQKRFRSLRYGIYEATLDSTTTVRTFAKRKTKILDTRGLYTVTRYPASNDPMETDLAPSDSIGVVWSPGCWRIRWCKGKRRNINSGPRLQLTKIEDAAGVYTIRRRQRGQRGWSAQIEVIVASCPQGTVQRKGDCNPRSNYPCLNGGVEKDLVDSCTCPPPFAGDDCSLELESSPLYTGILGQHEAEKVIGTLRCSDLDKGNEKCRGFLLCYAELYGCKCAPGWKGNKCDQACPKGRWGADCSQDCPSSESDCNRFRGPNILDTKAEPGR